MAEYTPKQRRRGLEFANRIAALAATAPDDVSKKAVFGAVRRIRECHGLLNTGADRPGNLEKVTMSDLTPRQRRRALDFGNCLAALVAAAPDPISKSAVRRAVRMIYKHHGLNDAQKRDVLAKALSYGASTYNELAAESGIRKPQVVAIIKQMETDGQVKVQRLPVGGKGGRPMLFITLCQDYAGVACDEQVS